MISCNRVIGTGSPLKDVYWSRCMDKKVAINVELMWRKTGLRRVKGINAGILQKRKKLRWYVSRALE